MIETIQQQGFSDLHSSKLSLRSHSLSRYFHKSPEQIQVGKIQDYFDHLAQKHHLSGATCPLCQDRCCLYSHGIRFLYLQVLYWEQFDVPIHYPKLEQKIPELLTRQEVNQIILACAIHKHRMMLMTCYGCGLRVSELVAMKVCHIDGKRKLLHVEQGKGTKDRAVVISPGLLDQLRRYWLDYRPDPCLFSPLATIRRNTYNVALLKGCSAAQKARPGSRKSAASIVSGIMPLANSRKAYPFINGRSYSDTKTYSPPCAYVHWIPGCHGGESRMRDLVGDLEVSDD